MKIKKQRAWLKSLKPIVLILAFFILQAQLCSPNDVALVNLILSTGFRTTNTTELICDSMSFEIQPSTGTRMQINYDGLDGFGTNIEINSVSNAQNGATGSIGRSPISPNDGTILIEGEVGLNTVTVSYTIYSRTRIGVDCTRTLEITIVEPQTSNSGSSSNDNSGASSQPSQPQLTMDCSSFILTSPTGGLENGDQTFYWDPASGAVSYTVIVSGEGGSVSYTTNAPNTTLTGNVSSNVLSGAGSFTVAVVATDANGNTCEAPAVTQQREAGGGGAAPPPPPPPNNSGDDSGGDTGGDCGIDC